MKKNLSILFILFSFVCALHAEPERVERPKPKSGCLLKLAVIAGLIVIGAAGVGYEVHKNFTVPPAHPRFVTAYEPKMDPIKKYFEIIRISRLASPYKADTGFDKAHKWIDSKIKLPNNWRPEDKLFKVLLLEWIASNDPDLKARKLAKDLLALFDGVVETDRGQSRELAIAHLGNSVPEWVHNSMDEEKIKAFQNAAKKGFTENQRLGLIAFDDGSLQTVSMLLRMAPGFLEKDISGKDAKEWISNATKKMDPNDMNLAMQLGQIAREAPSTGEILDIFFKMSPQAIIPFLQGSGGYPSMSLLLNLEPGKYEATIREVLKGTDESMQIIILDDLCFSSQFAKKFEKELNELEKTTTSSKVLSGISQVKQSYRRSTEGGFKLDK